MRIAYLPVVMLALLTLGCSLSGGSVEKKPTPISAIASPTAPTFPACTVYPNGEAAVNIHLLQDAASEVSGTLAPGTSIPVLLLDRGWYITGGEEGTALFHQHIDASLVSLAQPCHCTPSCIEEPLPAQQVYDGPITDCQVRPFSPVPVYAEPDGTSLQIATIGNDVTTYVFAQRDNFYKVYVPSISDYGWTGRGSLEALTACTNIPIESLTSSTECRVVNTSGDAIGVYRQANDTNSFIMRMSAGGSFVVSSREGDWFAVSLSATENGVDGTGYVQAADVTLEGPCDNFR